MIERKNIFDLCKEDLAVLKSPVSFSEVPQSPFRSSTLEDSI